MIAAIALINLLAPLQSSLSRVPMLRKGPLGLLH